MRFISTLLLLLVFGHAAAAQTTFTTPVGGQVSGNVPLCVNVSNQAVVPSSSCPLAVSVVSGGGGGGAPPTTFYTDTTTALTASSTFTGTARALPTSTSARYFYASIYSDLGSATNGFQILGYNGTGYVVVAEVTTVAATPAILQVPLIYSSYKVQLINGTTNQTTLWIQSGFAN